MKYYFMDYENVHMAGFDGIGTLEENTIIYVIYSEQSKTFSLDILEQAQKQGVIIKPYKVNVGNKNALDFQLCSFLGYKIGKSEDSNCEYIIISKDTGYDRVVEFWKNRNKSICRLVNLFEEANSVMTTSDFKIGEIIPTMTSTDIREPVSLLKPEPFDEENILLSREEIYFLLGNSSEKEIVNIKINELEEEKELKKENITQITKEELLQVLSKEEYSDKILEIVNSFKTKNEIHNALGREFRDTQKNGLIYRKLKPLLEEKKKS